MSPATIRARGLVHTYERQPVLSIPELDLQPARWHLAGPNGAGKTTLLRILATLTRPTRGEVTIAGHPLPAQAQAARAHIGYVGHDPSLHAALPTHQALALHARLHEVPTDQVDPALDAWGLAEARERRVASLSFGQRRRLDLARALLHEPDVLLLDEPARGLDEPGRSTLEDRIQHADPELVLAAAPEHAPIPVDGHLRLEDGQLDASDAPEVSPA